MISFRYHLVSIVAVFAALAVGIIAGSTVVKQSLVDSTKQNLERTERQLAEISAERDELGSELDRYEDFSAAASASLLRDRLDAVPLVVLEGTGIEADVRAGIAAAIDIGGARPIGRIRLDDSIADDDAALRIAGALDSSARDERQLRAELGRAIGHSIRELGSAAAASTRRQRAEEERATTTTTTSAPVPTVSSEPPVAATAAGIDAAATTDPAAIDTTSDIATTAPDSTTSTSTSTTTTVPLEVDPATWLDADPLDALDGANLIRVEESGDRFVPSAPITLLVIVDRRSGVTVHDVVVAALSELEGSDVAVVVAEAGLVPPDDDSTSDSVVAIVRSDGDLRDYVSTVDDAEGVAGWFAAVLALEERVAGGVGQYGRRDGSRSLLPTPT